MLNFADILTAYPPNLQRFKRNILREYLQYKILQIIFDSEFSSKLIFLGGTALRIVHQNSRFSEDIDFDNFNLTEKDFRKITEIIKKLLEHEGYQVEIKNVPKEAYRCYLRIPNLLFDYKLSNHREEKILIQLDTQAQRFNYEPTRYLLNKFDIFTEIFVTPLQTLLAQKIYAAYYRPRPKGRDFYDILFLLGKTTPDYQYLAQKIAINNQRELKDFFAIKNQELNFVALAKDVAPFLFRPQDAIKIKKFPQILEMAFK